MVDWLGTCMWGTPCLLSWVLDYSRKIPKKESVDDIDTFLKKNLGSYIFVTFSLENKLSPLEIPKICATPLGNSKINKLRTMENVHDFFLITPRKSTSLLLYSGISACFFQYPFKFHVLNPPNFFFFFFMEYGGNQKCVWIEWF